MCYHYISVLFQIWPPFFTSSHCNQTFDDDFHSKMNYGLAYFDTAINLYILYVLAMPSAAFKFPLPWIPIAIALNQLVPIFQCEIHSVSCQSWVARILNCIELIKFMPLGYAPPPSFFQQHSLICSFYLWPVGERFLLYNECPTTTCNIAKCMEVMKT